jgi:hypothetical protein
MSTIIPNETERIGYIKAKQSHNTPMEALGENWYSSYSFSSEW